VKWFIPNTESQQQKIERHITCQIDLAGLDMKGNNVPVDLVEPIEWVLFLKGEKQPDADILNNIFIIVRGIPSPLIKPFSITYILRRHLQNEGYLRKRLLILFSQQYSNQTLAEQPLYP
jgi:hypothetical protein